MPRNLKNRIEQCTPILNENIRSRIIKDLELYINDNSSSWLMQADGKYILTETIQNESTEANDETVTINAQSTLLEKLSESF